MLLIVSIFFIRSKVMKMSQRKLSNRDCLMTVHTICFALVIISNVISQILQAGLGEEYKDTATYCRTRVTQVYFQSLSVTINIGIVLLFVYMAANMCNPL